MARIKSSAVGKGSGSAGVLTYRSVRGRTIISSRVTENKSRTDQQVLQRASFGELQRLGKELRSVIGIGFDKTELGSEYNNFMMQNKAYMDYVRVKGGMDRDSEPLYNLWLALRDKELKGKVIAALGTKKIITTYRWDENGVPVIRVIHYQPFQAGDRVTFVFGVTGLYEGQQITQLEMVEKVLEESDIAGFANGRKAVFDKANCPQLDFRGLLPEETESLCVVATAIVTEPNGEHSTSYFSAMPICPVLCTASEHKFVSEGKMEVTFSSAETFPAVLSRDAIGASLRFPGLTGSQSYLVTGFVKDGQEQPIGLVVEDQIGADYDVEPLGVVSEPCPLSKNGQVIALIDGLKTPSLVG